MKSLSTARLSCWPRLRPRRYLSSRRALQAVVLFVFVALGPGGWTQYPFTPPPAVGLGPTPGASLRNAAAATLTQAGLVRKAAYDWGRRAGWATYTADHFQNDFSNMQLQFQVLRSQMNGLVSLVAGLDRPRANNAAAELDAGLNVISELFTFLSNQFNAGTLDRNTIVRTCRAFEDAMRQWEREFKKNDVRLGVVW